MTPPSPRETPPRAIVAPGGWARYLPGILSALAFAVYIPSLQAAFQWDDLILLFRPELGSFSLDHLRWMWSAALLGHYTPVTWMSWSLDRALWGLSPAGFRLTNLALHAANTALVYGVARRLGGLASPRTPAADLRWGAAAAALFFALHPLRVETVVWVTERRGLLSAFFCLAAALRHWGGDERWPPVLLALGVLSKETAMMAPVGLWLVDAGVLGRTTWSGWWKKNRLLWIAGLLGAVAGAWATRHEDIPVSLLEHGPHARVVQYFHGLTFLAGKTLWPAGLSPLYPLALHQPVIPFGRCALAGLGGLGVLAALLFFRRAPGPAAGGLFFAACLFPTGGILQSGAQDTADRYAYLAALPWAFLFGEAARRSRGLLAVLPVLAALTVRQEAYWRTPESLWRRAAAVSPDADLAWLHLGDALAGERPAEAEAAFRRSLALQPTSLQAMLGLAGLYRRRGDLARAEEYYRRALWVAPEDPAARDGLARVSRERGR